MPKNIKKLIRKKIRLGLKKAYFSFALASILLNTMTPFFASYSFVAHAQDTQESSSSVTEADQPEEQTQVETTTPIKELIVESAQTENITGDATTEPSQGDVPDDIAVDFKEEPTTPQDIVEAKEKVSEKECIASDASMTTTDESIWNKDEGEKSAETNDNVQLGVKYEFPFNHEVSLTFTCLPKNEEDRSTLSIKLLDINDINLPEEVNAVGDYAYDLNTDMENGTFEYTLTLPKPEDLSSTVNYIEKSADEIASAGTIKEDLKVVSDEYVDQDFESNSVKVSELDHFTIFILTYSGPTFSTTKTVYTQGETVYAKAQGLNTSEYYKMTIDPPSGNDIFITSCFNPSSGNTALTGTYVLPTDATISTNWSVEIQEFDHSTCSDNPDEKDDSAFSVEGAGKIEICHATSSHSNPYVTNEPSKIADAGGHDGHNGPAWFPGINVTWGDIIPPFDYVGGSYAGKNWTAEGQAIYNNGCSIPKGTVIVHKDVQGPNGEDVTDNSNYFEVSLDGAAGQAISDNLTVIYNDVPVGNHTITESLIDSDYTLYGISTAPGTSGNTSGLTINVIIGTNDVYVTNRQHSGTITVVKDVVDPSGEPVSDTHSFTANLDPGDQSSPFAEGNNAVFTVNPGTYTVSEGTDADYTNLGCLTATGKTDIVVGSGKSATVTCVNTRNTGGIEVTKFNDTNSNGQQDSGEPELEGRVMHLSQGESFSADQATNALGLATFTNLPTGSYILSEPEVLGWTLTNISCSSDAPSTVPAIDTSNSRSVDVSTGTSVTCKVGNFQNVSITACKSIDVDGNGTGDQLQSDWGMSLSNNDLSVGETSVTGVNGCYTWDNLGPGLYEVVEEDRTGYTNVTPLSYSFGSVTSNQEGLTYTFINRVNASCGDGVKNSDAEQCDGTDGVTLGENFCTAICKLVPIYNGENQCSPGFVKGELAYSGDISSTDTNGETLGLISGQEYLFQASQTFIPTNAPGYLADAGYTWLNGIFAAQYGIGGTSPDLGAHVLLGDLGLGVGIINWGSANDSTHTYDFSYTPTNVSQQFVIGDRYSDWFDTPYQNQSGMSDNSGSLHLDVYECVRPPVTLVAQKVVCTDESQLPNWGNHGGTIDANTALNWVDDHDSCSLATDWQFQWAPAGAGSFSSFQTDTGLLGGSWTTFDANTPTEINDVSLATSHIEVREVFPNANYLGFTNDDNNSVSSEFYCTGDVFNYDNWEWINNPQSDNTYYCVGFNALRIGTISGIKYFDRNANGFQDGGDVGLAGWAVELKDGDAVIDSIITDENGDYSFANLVTGTYQVCEVNQAGWTPTNPSSGCSDLLTVVANQTTTQDFANTQLSNITIIKDVPTYEDATEFEFTFDDEENFNLSEIDTPQVYENLTPEQTYSISETLNSAYTTTVSCIDESEEEVASSQDGSIRVTPTAGDNIICTFTNTRKPATLIATKIVCDNEVDLPNWGTGGPNVTATTAANFLESRPNCRLEPDWNFQWLYTDATNPGDNTGESVLPAWHTFGPTGSDGTASTEVGELNDSSYLWMREVWNSDYLPFSYSANQDNSDDVSAELYCNTDVLNYDNWDRVDGVQYGGTYYCIAFNVLNTGSIGGTKYRYTGELSDGPTSTIGDWSIYLYDTDWDQIGSTVLTDEEGNYVFDQLTTGTYNVCEENRVGWQQMSPTEGVSDESGRICHQVTLTPGQTVTDQDFTNAELTDVHGYKWEDINGNGLRDVCGGGDFRDEECIDEPLLDGWRIFIDENDNQTYDGGADGEPYMLTSDSDDENFGWFWFENLLPDTYTICEELQPGWEQTFPIENACHTVTIPNDEPQSVNGVVGPEYDFGNARVPVLTISKTNDAPLSLHHGDHVTYSIRIHLDELGGNMHDVFLRDLLPRGFSYLSWSSPDPQVTLLHEPHSPGDWNIGDMSAGDTVTVNITAEVQSDVDPGTYKDLAWANGDSAYGANNILAVAVSPGQITDNFVGTQVAVVADSPAEVTADVKEKEIVEEKEEVLGASTELPASGANTNWLYAVIAMALGGLSMILYGKKQKKNSGAKVLITCLMAMSLGFSSPQTFATEPNPLVVSVEQPSSPQNAPFNITFVVLDTSDPSNLITAQCKKQKDGGVFESFGTPISIDAGGGTTDCVADSSVLDGEGSYKFRVDVTNGTSTNFAETASVTYDAQGPDKPRYIKKDKQSSCVYEVKVKTADDGETAKIEIYRDDDKNIQVNDGSRIDTHSMGPNEIYTYTDTLSGSCDKPYYATRAFDANGNVSDVRVEEIETNTTTTTTTTENSETTVGAIPTSGSNLSESVTTETTGGAQGTVLGESSETTNAGEQGIVAGASQAVKTLASKPWFWILLILGTLFGAYAYKNRKVRK